MTKEESIQKTVNRAREILNKHYGGKIKGLDCLITESEVKGREPVYGFRFNQPGQYRINEKVPDRWGCVTRILFALK